MIIFLFSTPASHIQIDLSQFLYRIYIEIISFVQGLCTEQSIAEDLNQSVVYIKTTYAEGSMRLKEERENAQVGDLVVNPPASKTQVTHFYNNNELFKLILFQFVFADMMTQCASGASQNMSSECEDLNVSVVYVATTYIENDSAHPKEERKADSRESTASISGIKQKSKYIQ